MAFTTGPCITIQYYMYKIGYKFILTTIIAFCLFACKSTKNTVGEVSDKPKTHQRKTTEQDIEAKRNLRDEDKSIVFLFDNDVHCNIDGYVRMAGLRQEIRDTALCGLVSCGDYLQGGTTGSISKGQYIVDIMKKMDYTVVGVGNHEFDFKMPHTLELLEQIGAPVTCLNVRDKATGKSIFAPYVIVNVANKKIAFVGVLTPTAFYTENAAFCDDNGNPLYDLCENNLYDEVQYVVNNARYVGADYVVLLSHVGDEDNVCHITSTDLIKSTYGIDAVLDAHSHSVVPMQKINNKKGLPVVIAQTGTQFQNVGKLLIEQDGTISTELIPYKKILYRDPDVAITTDSIKALYNAIVSRPVGVSEYNIPIRDEKGKQIVRLQETTSGNLATDAYRNVTNADISIVNGGGIRKDLKAGDVTYGDIIGMLPYENYVCIVETTGAKILELLNKCVALLPSETGDFPQVSGMRYTINMNQNPRVTDVKILDRNSDRYMPLDVNKTYTIGTMDYCVTGGGLAGVLKDAKIIRQNIMLYNEALSEYISKFLNGQIGIEYSKPENRIQIIK